MSQPRKPRRVRRPIDPAWRQDLHAYCREFRGAHERIASLADAFARQRSGKGVKKTTVWQIQEGVIKASSHLDAISLAWKKDAELRGLPERATMHPGGFDEDPRLRRIADALAELDAASVPERQIDRLIAEFLGTVTTALDARTEEVAQHLPTAALARLMDRRTKKDGGSG